MAVDFSILVLDVGLIDFLEMGLVDD